MYPESDNRVWAKALIYLLFAAVLFTATYGLDTYKESFLLYLLTFLIMVLASLYAKAPYKTRIPFYVLLFLLLLNAFYVAGLPIMNYLQPDDGWYTEPNGIRHRVMQTNWAYGLLAGMFLAPLIVWLYSKLPQQSPLAESILVVISLLLCLYALFL